MADEGQWKGMPLPKTREGRRTTGASQFVRAGNTFSGGVAEGFKAGAKVTAKSTHRFKTAPTLELALYRNLRAQQEPIPTHRFF